MLNKQTQLLGALLGAVIVIGIVLALTKSTPPVELTPEPTAVEVVAATTSQKVIGSSVEGREIEVFTFGTGETDLLFVGGIHGGYEWNTVVLAEELIAGFSTGALPIPDRVTVHIIPVLNPDGVHEVLGMTGGFTASEANAIAPEVMPAGRFNANGIDLNRNFDCKWQPTSTWRGEVVSAGSAPFSEPEAAALRDYVLEIDPSAVVFWHSRANNVYGSECEEGVIATTETLMKNYAQAAGYGEVLTFDAYPVSGDAEGWLASIGIPAITVELETRTDSEYIRNRNGTLQVLSMYGDLGI